MTFIEFRIVSRKGGEGNQSPHNSMKMSKLDEYTAENLEWAVEQLEKTAPRAELAAAYRDALKRAGNVAYLDKLIPELQNSLPGLPYWYARKMLLSKSEATYFAGCSLPALNDAIRRGKLRCWNVDGGPHILLFDALELAGDQGTPERSEKVEAEKVKTVIRVTQDGVTTLKTIEHAPVSRGRKR